MNGYDESGTTLSLAKQLLMDCQTTGDITIPRETLRIVLMAYIHQWNGDQDRKRSDYKKVATNG